MQHKESNPPSAVSRREFLRTSTLAAASAAGGGALLSACASRKTAVAAAVAAAPAIVQAQTKPAINAVIIGVGGRGGGAGKNLLDAAKIAGVEAKILAVADLFPEQARRGQENFELPPERCFSGFDSYQKALDIPGVNYAILAAPPGFRPPHFKACIEAGKHVFMEKPVAVDGPGCRIMHEAAALARQKNLKVVAGTQRRHQADYLETIKRLKDGAIGDIHTLRAYWVNGGPIWHRGEKGDTTLEIQIRNWYHYIWLCGDHISEQHVHNIDVCNWIMDDAHPVKCWGLGARQQLGDKPGEIWDNFAVEYEYANGARMFSYCGQVKRDWSSVSEGVQGTRGSSNPKGIIQPKDGPIWRYREKYTDPYVQEHVDLIHAIVSDTPLNEADRVTDSTMTAIMGREAAYSGAGVTWEEIENSTFHYGPELLYTNCAKLEFGPFRTLQPPMPGSYNILKDPPVTPVKA